MSLNEQQVVVAKCMQLNVQLDFYFTCPRQLHIFSVACGICNQNVVKNQVIIFEISSSVMIFVQTYENRISHRICTNL
jgi:hypothetical protein